MTRPQVCLGIGLDHSQLTEDETSASVSENSAAPEFIHTRHFTTSTFKMHKQLEPKLDLGLISIPKADLDTSI